MYEKRFGLHRKPFQSVLTDHDFYQSESFREVLPGILHALRSDLGVAVLTGPTGVGKTTTLDSVRRTLETDSQAVLIRGGSVRSAADLLYLLHRQLLKCQPAAEESNSLSAPDAVRRWAVVERLQRVSEFWGPLIILLDDAHLVQPEVFSELRALLEEEVSGQKLLHLLISGPLVLEEVLAEPARSDFAQKIRTHSFLQPLRSSEAVDFLQHNVTNAGGELSTLMNNEALERIVAAADGIPRCLNLLADETLIVCEELDIDCATRKTVDLALGRLQHLPYAWNVSLCSDEEDDVERVIDDHSEPTGSIVEFGDSAETQSFTDSNSVEGVIEIGGPASEPLRESNRAPSTAQPEVDRSTPGVIEIGAPASKRSKNDEPAKSAEVEVSKEFATPETVVEIVQEPTAAVETDVVSEVDSSDEPVVESVVEWSAEATVQDNFRATEIDSAAFFAQVDGDRETPDSLETDETVPLEPDKAASAVDTDPVDDVVFSDTTDESTASDGLEAPVGHSNLEHHLLLAGADDELIETNDLNDRSDDHDAAVEAEDHAVEFGHYSRWEPAGSWPAEAALSDSVSSLSEPIAVASPLPQRRVERPNAKPVFDRYTWCELGRSVSPDPNIREENTLTMTAVSEWPPRTTGVAPESEISVEHIGSSYAALLSDINDLIDVTDEDVPTTTVPIGNFSPEATALLLDGSPDAAIDQIQSLIDDEQNNGQNDETSQIDSELTDVPEDLLNGIVEPKDIVAEAPSVEFAESDWAVTSDDSEPLDSGPLEGDSAMDWTEVESSSVDDEVRKIFPVFNEDRDTVTMSEHDRPQDASHDELHAEPESLSGLNDPSLVAPTDVGEVDDADVIREPDDEEEEQARNELVCDERQIGDFVADAEEEGEQVYVPRLMRQARIRLSTQSMSGGQLRRAAGAETYVADSENDSPQNEAVLTIADELPDLEDTEHLAAETEVDTNSAGRFRNLFTRLRQRRGRSA